MAKIIRIDDYGKYVTDENYNTMDIDNEIMRTDEEYIISVNNKLEGL